MTMVVNGYFIETGHGFSVEHCTVTIIKGIDEFGRRTLGACVFQGSWNECEEYARTH